jgi:acyl-CoA thioesterase-1
MLQIISNFASRFVPASIILLLVVSGSGCDRTASLEPPPPEPSPVAAPSVEPAIRIVVLGDSLAAGLGLAEDESFPMQLEAMLVDRGFDVEVVNAGVSGDTSAGGLARLGWVLHKPADILVVELGGNDALRGQPLENTEANLAEIVRLGRKSGAVVVLLGMDVPSNYGPDYSAAFAELYVRAADEGDAVLVPNFVHGIGSDPELIQPDGLHPTAEGQRRLAETLLPYVVEILESG